ncbi:unnamed protein product [Somion occarium]|uniref:B box-type domain-containing protein n=1 Tax=Somion occarium TaxID=3059160 RepID=A0ABP1D016_9APHY
MALEEHTQQEAQPAAGFSLANILSGSDENLELPNLRGKSEEVDSDGETSTAPAAEGYCVECEDQPAQLHCEGCADDFCEVCFAAQHRKGSRKRHATKPLKRVDEAKKKAKLASEKEQPSGSQGHEDAMDTGSDESDAELEQLAAGPSTTTTSVSVAPEIGAFVGDWFLDRSKYIPMRLELAERKYLRLLEAALNVSEYTDKIDTIGFRLSKAKRIVHQIRELCAIMSGLVLAADYKQGQELFTDREFKENEDFFQKIFELGRRHKIMNPDKMRSTYGKLIYLLQDSQSPEVIDMLGFSCVQPIRTVYTVLEEQNALDLLREDLVSVATKEIYSEGRTRRDIQKDIRSKEKAIEALSAKYQRKGLSQETIRQCLYSIGDNHAFLRTNRDPCDKMIAYLKQYFHPTKPNDGKSSLAIKSGKDLLSENVPYRLRDTGQGLNRVQAAPKTSRMMHVILNRAQRSIGSWVGSSVIHMGDHNVPNALMFIDKYSQIYRILLPICNTISKIPELMTKHALRSYIENEFGSAEGCSREILGDFFRHGFDGSGADNFFDAGSCIDGRLTSAWNWCNSLEKKRYFPVFLLAGFIGFDGDW